MTRINVIDPAELVDKHLVAEYRELPRLFTLIENWQARGCPGPIPPHYTLGKGHVKFFYPRAMWLALRFDELVAEMLDRGFKPQYLTQVHRLEAIGRTGQEDDLWVAPPSAIALNRGRIADRLREIDERRRVG